MKLFLSSAAILPEHAQALADLLGKPLSVASVAYIDNGADPYSGRPAWIDEPITALRSLGLDVNLVNLNGFRQKPDALTAALAQNDVIWLGGGNVFYLRWLLRETKADTVIKNLVELGSVFGGGSAGAIVAGPTLKYFETSDDPRDAPSLVLDGLHLTETVVVPHTDNVKYAQVIAGINRQLVAAGHHTAPLTDTQTLVINGSSQTVI